MLPRRLVMSLLVLVFLAGTATVAAPDTRVIVLGFDGADDVLTREYLELGYLPNLARLRDMGAYRPLDPTNPAQSPVSWASFATGTNPGKTGIYDFLKRAPGTYDPQLGLSKKIWSRDFTPQAGKRWLGRILAVLVVLGLCFLVVRLVLGKRSILWAPIGLVLGLLAAFALEHFVLQHIPETLPTAVNRRQGQTFWQILGEKGIRSVVVEAPTSFPADKTENGKVLSGLGVPDIRASFGTYFVWSNDPTLPPETEMGAVVKQVEPDANGVVRTWVSGPENFLLPQAEQDEARDKIRRLEDQLPYVHRQDQPAARARIDEYTRQLRASIPVEIVLHRGAEPSATFRVQGQEKTVPLGTWSEHFEFTFELNPMVKPSGIARFILSKCEERTYTVALSMINWNPKKVPPNVPITEPHDWAAELGESLGDFDTLGWACITSGVKDEMLGEAEFLAHTNLLLEGRERKTRHLLKKGGWDCFVSVLTETDRVQHMMWRLIDEKSPKYDAGLAAKYGDAILDVYKRMDRLVGEVMDEYLDENTVLLVCSDHGFQSFRRSVNLNTWLARKGFMTLQGQGKTLGLTDLFDRKAEMFSNVDWSRTKAYSMGLGKIYINLKGREPEGIVTPAEYDDVRQGIIDGLLELHDDDGTKVVEAVYRREDLYAGGEFEAAEDLILGFRPGYRVGWQTTLGGTPPDIIEDNLQKWSGDHCSFDPKFVQGILLSSRPVVVEHPSIMDLAPTVLSLMGVPVDPVMDGRVIIER